MKQSLKTKAIRYRKAGYSYNLIRQKIAVSKSTLSNWLQEIPFSPNKTVLNRIGRARAKTAQFKNAQKLESIKQAKREAIKELGALSKRDLMLLGIGLYMGEGTKSYENIRVINSDPQIIILMIRWLKEACSLKIKNLKLTIHIYPDLDENSVKKYWSKQTGVPLNQFCKTQIDLRADKKFKKKHMLPYGTAHLSVVSRGEKKFGVYLHRKILGWIEHVNSFVRV